MKTLCDDLQDEYRALAGLCDTLTPAQWQTRSAFHGWTPWDEIAHLCYFDEAALLAAADPEAFAAGARALGARIAAGEEISAIARAHYAGLDGQALTGRWRDTFVRLVTVLNALDGKARLPWYGPPMSALSFASARLMETWAHGQDVWDAIARLRPETLRLRHIAHIGVNTFGWSFANRGLPVPASKPRVELQAPDGSLWTWGEADAEDRIDGTATDFCLLVTQRRHRDDTGLRWQGDNAARWLEIAQCFAGPPADGPAPGVRVLHRGPDPVPDRAG